MRAPKLDNYISVTELTKRFDSLRSSITMSIDIYHAICVIIAPEIYASKDYDKPTQAEPGSDAKIRIMIDRVRRGLNPTSPGDRKKQVTRDNPKTEHRVHLRLNDIDCEGDEF